MSGRHVGRRSAAAGGIATLIPAATAAGSAKAEELDGELLKLCRAFEAQEDELDRIWDTIGDMPMAERGAHPLALKEDQGVARIHELRGLIAELPAQTPEGIRVKAKAAFVDFSPGDEWLLDNSQWIAWSLVRDLLGKGAA